MERTPIFVGGLNVVVVIYTKQLKIFFKKAKIKSGIIHRKNIQQSKPK